MIDLYIGLSLYELGTSFELDFDTTGSIETNPLMKATGKDKIFFIEMPIGITIGKSKGKNRFYWDFALLPSFDFLYKSKYEIHYADGTIDKMKSHGLTVSYFFLGASTGFGWEYNFNEKMNIRIAPIFKSNILLAGSYGVGFGAFWSAHLKLNFNLYFAKKSK